MEGWQRHYPGMIEWIDADTHGGLKNINVSKMEFETDLDTFKADAACVVPGQKAGAIAMALELTMVTGVQLFLHQCNLRQMKIFMY